MGETWQTILNVILNEGQTQNLVTWILENPSIGPDAVSWAASKATNLPKPSKVKVRPRKDKDLGLGVS
jgi:hypothetical protein